MNKKLLIVMSILCFSTSAFAQSPAHTPANNAYKSAQVNNKPLPAKPTEPTKPAKPAKPTPPSQPSQPTSPAGGGTSQ